MNAKCDLYVTRKAKPNDAYRQVSNIERTKSQDLKRFSYCLAAFLAESLQDRCQVENEDVCDKTRHKISSSAGDHDNHDSFYTLTRNFRYIFSILEMCTSLS